MGVSVDILKAAQILGLSGRGRYCLMLKVRTEGIKVFVRGNKLSVTGFEVIKNLQHTAVGLCVLVFFY